MTLHDADAILQHIRAHQKLVDSDPPNFEQEVANEATAQQDEPAQRE